MAQKVPAHVDRCVADTENAHRPPRMSIHVSPLFQPVEKRGLSGRRGTGRRPAVLMGTDAPTEYEKAFARALRLLAILSRRRSKEEQSPLALPATSPATGSCRLRRWSTESMGPRSKRWSKEPTNVVEQSASLAERSDPLPSRASRIRRTKSR
jgi:hypothetical protein